jgi:hypothetical protein
MQGGVHIWLTLPLLAVVALVLSGIVGAGLLQSAISVGIALPAIILVRVAIDGTKDPSNHNLWPFEVLMASALGMASAFPSAAIGWLLRKVIHRPQPNNLEPKGNE